METARSSAHLEGGRLVVALDDVATRMLADVASPLGRALKADAERAGCVERDCLALEVARAPRVDVQFRVDSGRARWYSAASAQLVVAAAGDGRVGPGNQL